MFDSRSTRSVEGATPSAPGSSGVLIVSPAPTARRPPGGTTTPTRALAIDAVSTRVTAAILCSLFVAVPFLVVRFPPITDLPQHVAQIRLFLAALGNPGSGYLIQWFTPYSAVYGLLGAAWALCGPANAGRVAVLALGVLWTLAVHGLAARRRRPVAAAVLASMLFFSHVLYWGFLNFAVGWLAFIVWLLVTARAAPNDRGWRAALPQFGAAVLLYLSHVLWFAFGIAWLPVYAAVHRWPRRVLLWRLLGVAPVVAAAALWYPHLEALGFASPTVWFTPLPARLAPEWVVNAVLGGVQGSMEYLVAGVLLAWVAGGLWQGRGARRAGIDVDLLWTGLLLIALGLTLPDKYTNTIQFAARWMPVGALLIVLAVPPPAVLASLQRVLALTVVAFFCCATATAWVVFERDELSGLSEALAAMPDGQRVIGLDLVQESRVIKGRPFLQMFAYAQVRHGGRLNASFAGLAPSLVVYRQHVPAPWTANLEWFADQVRPDDLRFFDYALINGGPEIHAQAAAMPLSAVTADGRWRLYRVTAPTP
jgi:hypothetical protein